MLGQLLHAPVERQDQAVAGNRVDGSEPAHQLALRVDLDAFAAGLAAQHVIVANLEALFADDVVRRVPLVFERVVFVFGDRADVAEDVRTELVIRIVAHRLSLQIDAGQLILRFGQTRHLRGRQIAREDDGAVRFRAGYFVEIFVVDAAMVQEALPERSLGDVEHARQLA